MDITQQLNWHVRNVNVNESLTALIKNKIASQKRENYVPNNYFFVIHLCNPAQTYWSFKNRTTEKSNKLARKLLLGKQLERFASVWFKSISGFNIEEGKLDGVWVGIPGVRGSLDYKIDDSLIEFKTKDELPMNIQEIFTKYPQDLEQLVFYAVLHPNKPDINYLVFMKNSTPFELKVYKIMIKDFGRLKTLLITRIKQLNSAIEKNNPSDLGRCRYYGNDCQYEENHICSCKEFDPLPITSLQESIEIEYDEDYTTKLEKAKNESDTPKSMFTTKDIIAPRQYYLKNELGKETEWKPDNLIEEYKACIGNLVRYSSFFLPPDKNKNMIIKSLKEPRLRVAYRWLKLKSSVNPGGEIVPYLAKVSSSKSLKYTNKPHEYFLAELAIITAAYGKSKGYIFIVYPYLDDLVKVFEVTFKEPEKILEIITSRIDSIIKACESKNLHLMSPCPEFMNDNKKCPLIEDCHTIEGQGCIKDN